MLLAFELGDLQVKHKVAMLALGHPDLAHVSKPLPIDVNAQSNEFCVRYYYTGAQRPELVVRSGTHIVDPSAEKIRAHRFFETTLLREQIAWFPCSATNELRVEINVINLLIPLYCTGRTQCPPYRRSIPAIAIRAATISQG